jgi:hypothetical protein
MLGFVRRVGFALKNCSGDARLLVAERILVAD